MSLKLTKRPANPKQIFRVYRQTVKSELQPVVDRRVKEYERQTAGWQPQHQPDFQGQVVGPTQGTAKIFFRVVIRNASKVFNKYGTTIRQLWDIWNEGSRPHTITPRFATVLRFVIGGKTIFTKLVRHPGTKGSGAKERIDKRLGRTERRSIDRAIQKALKKAERAR